MRALATFNYLIGYFLTYLCAGNTDLLHVRIVLKVFINLTILNSQPKYCGISKIVKQFFFHFCLQGRPQVFSLHFQRGAKMLLSDFDQKSYTCQNVYFQLTIMI